jgi:hypothetical protein
MFLVTTPSGIQGHPAHPGKGSIVKKLIIVGVALLAAWFFATPYLTFYAIKSAAEDKDVRALSQYIDFPALKESLKANLRRKITKTLAKTHDDNPYGNLLGAAGSQLAVQMIDPLLDAAITPEAVAELLQARHGKAESGPGGDAGNPLSFVTSDKEIAVSTGYRSFDAFAITLKEKDSGKELAAFILKRQGMFAWKVTEVIFPD